MQENEGMHVGCQPPLASTRRDLHDELPAATRARNLGEGDLEGCEASSSWPAKAWACLHCSGLPMLMVPGMLRKTMSAWACDVLASNGSVEVLWVVVVHMASSEANRSLLPAAAPASCHAASHLAAPSSAASSLAASSGSETSQHQEETPCTFAKATSCDGSPTESDAGKE